jgi:hypothetical protein
VFGRSKATTVEGATPSSVEAKDGSKGRPTPKRREVERGRRRAVATPRTRKEAAAAMRAKQREERQSQMTALRAGDERTLPARDRGPVRRYARDVVDSRRTVAEFFLPLAVGRIAQQYTHIPNLPMAFGSVDVVLLACVVYDTIRNRRLHPAFVLGLVVTLAWQAAVLAFGKTAGWAHVAAWLVSLT